MARTSATTVDSTFIGGLITDYTALNFPENACTEAINCIFEPNGRVSRRRGFDYEEDYEMLTVTRDQDAIVSFIWREVNGDGTQNFVVLQVGTVLHFYRADSLSISSTRLDTPNTTINLEDHAVDDALPINTRPCQFAYGNGVLFVAHPYCNTFTVTYDPIAVEMVDKAISIRIRDLSGIDDEVAIDNRPGSLTNTHEYNLLNQGWYFNDTLAEWNSAHSNYPSNADVWWFFKDENDEYDPTLIDRYDRGNTRAPKGHFILNPFDTDREGVSGVANLDNYEETTNPYRPSAVSFFAGRVWYAGLVGAKEINKLYFSQIIESSEDFGKCYQRNDPTSETLFDLLPTDGGVIELSGAGHIYKLFPYGNALLVFASNGIWAISGSEGLGFVANDFSITKISAIELENSSSFVSVEGSPFWWTGSSINTVVTDDNRIFNVQSISDHKIRRLFMSIPEICKQQAVGAYDEHERTIYWLFRMEEPPTIDDSFNYDHILTYNGLTQAFSLWKLPSNHRVTVNSIQTFKGFTGETEAVTVVDNEANVVVDDLGRDVVLYDLQGNTRVSIFKYVCSTLDPLTENYEFTFAEASNLLHIDWYSMDTIGVPYLSTFTTGYRLSTDTQRFFQPNYIFVFLEEVAQNSSCYVQAVFDYTTSGDTGKWSSKQQVYNTSLISRAVNYRRLKLRGKGRSLQLKFTSVDQAPFGVIGWSIWNTANREV